MRPMSTAPRWGHEKPIIVITSSGAHLAQWLPMPGHQVFFSDTAKRGLVDEEMLGWMTPGEWLAHVMTWFQGPVEAEEGAEVDGWARYIEKKRRREAEKQ
jgi:hypothetical protein